ncbi:hypothetical protein [Methyloversatilis sp.]|uniref:hypothetical protein n=1 Tax=Methyloversatilis sp. TaxID=2569862 RepID=UPI003D27C667
MPSSLRCLAATASRRRRPTLNRALDRMVESIKAGRLDGLMPVDRHGRAVRLG